MDPRHGASPIVYVEDDRLVFRATERMAGALGVAMIGADSGESARALLAEMDPAVILIDAALPDCDGVALATELSDRMSCPIVMVSGRRRPEGLELVWLNKPFRREDFQAMLVEVAPHLLQG